MLKNGFQGKREEIANEIKKYSAECKEYYELYAMNLTIDAICLLAEKFRKEADRMGITELAEALSNVPLYAPRSYYEALVMMRLVNFALWLNGNKHNTLGRFDVYMYPYFKADIASGKLTREKALELTGEFFVDLNFDADLYPGVQQGDNGQSMVLGGMGADGEDVFNELSKICLEASLAINLIDPKINIRVSKNTPFSTYYLGTLLTKQGLGFPQYSNDDVVIPALMEMGYSQEDARNYVVAACWEFIIPGVAYDIPNVDALSYPDVMLSAVARLEKFSTFAKLMAAVKGELTATCKKLIANTKNIFVEPSPFQSVVMTDCIKEAKDIADGSKYNNYGFHGAGLSTAADSLAAIKKLVYDEKKYTATTFKNALAANFKGYEKLLFCRRFKGRKERARRHFPRGHGQRNVLYMAVGTSRSDARRAVCGRTVQRQLFPVAQREVRRCIIGHSFLYKTAFRAYLQRRAAHAGIPRYALSQRRGNAESGKACETVRGKRRASVAAQRYQSRDVA